MNFILFPFVVSSLIFILTTAVNSKKLCDVRTWYLNIITDDVFKVELNEEQSDLKDSIQALVMNAAENRESRMTDCHILHMYNDLLMERFNYRPSKKIMTIEFDEKEINAVKSKENTQENGENAKSTHGDIHESNIKTQDSRKPTNVENINKELDIMDNVITDDFKYLKNTTKAADTNITENNSNSYVTKSKTVEEIKVLDECEDKNCNQVSYSIDKHNELQENIVDNNNNKVDNAYVTNNVLDDTQYTDLDDNVLEDSENPCNTYQEVVQTNHEIDKVKTESMSASRSIPVGVCWPSRCFMSDVFYYTEKNFNFESDNVTIQTSKTSQTSVVHEYCPLGSFCLDQCHYILSISFCTLGYSTNITYSKTHNDTNVTGHQTLIDTNVTEHPTLIDNDTNVTEHPTLIDNDTNVTEHPTLIDNDTNVTEHPTLIDNDTNVVARMRDKVRKNAEHLYGIPRKPHHLMILELCPNDTFCLSKCYFIISWNLCIEGYGDGENVTVSGGSYANDTYGNLEQVQNNDANNSISTDYESKETDTSMKILEKNDSPATESEILELKHAAIYKENLNGKAGLDDQVFVGPELQQKLKGNIVDNVETTKLNTMVNLDDSIKGFQNKNTNILVETIDTIDLNDKTSFDDQVFLGRELQQKLKENIEDNTETTKSTTAVNLDDSVKGSQHKNSNILVKNMDKIDCPTKITYHEIQTALNLEFDKVIEQKTGGYYKKVQMLEVLIMKLENQLLLEMLNKQNHSSTITRLENHILKLENELLKISNNYEKLKEEADSINKRTSKYLQLDHYQRTQNPEASGTSVKTFAEIEQHQAKINELISILRNQTNVIKEMKEKYDILEEQNRKLHQIVVNQTFFMTSVMLMVQNLSEQNAKSRQEIIQLQQQLSHAVINTMDASHGKPREDALVNDNIIKRLDSLPFDDPIYLRSSILVVESSKKNDTGRKELPQVSKYLTEDTLKSWCTVENQSCVFCLYHSTLHSNCVPYRAMFWSACVGNKTFDILNKSKTIDYPDVPHGQHHLRDGKSDDEKHKIHAASGVAMVDNDYVNDELDQTKHQLSKNVFLHNKGKTIEVEPNATINEQYQDKSIDSKLNEKYLTSENMLPRVFKDTSSNEDDSETNPQQNINLNSSTVTDCNNEGTPVTDINELQKDTKIKPLEANKHDDSPVSSSYNTELEDQRTIKEPSQANIHYDKTKDKTDSILDIQHGRRNINEYSNEHMLESINEIKSKLKVNVETDAKVVLDNEQVSDSNSDPKELKQLQNTDKIGNIVNTNTDKLLQQKHYGKISGDTLKSPHIVNIAETSIKSTQNTESELNKIEATSVQTNSTLNNVNTDKSEIGEHDEHKPTNVDNKEPVEDIKDDEDKKVVDNINENRNEQQHEGKISDDTLKSLNIVKIAETGIKAAQNTERELNQIKAAAIQTNLTMNSVNTEKSEIDKNDQHKPTNVDNKELVKEIKEDEDKKIVDKLNENKKEKKHEDKISDDTLKSPHVEKIAEKTIKTAQNTGRELNIKEATAIQTNLTIEKQDQHKLINVEKKDPVKEIKDDEDKNIFDKVKGSRKAPKYLATDKQREPKDCYDHFMRGEKKDGVYKIKLEGLNETIQVFCEMKRGGWTFIQRRQDGSTNFYLTWRDYKKGFGGLYGEHWLGNDNIHYLTNQDHYKLRVDLMDWNNQMKYADFEYFMIDGEDEGYELHIDSYSGDAGDGLTKHDGNKFSTKDVDNDKVVKEFGGSCAARFQGAGWYYKCYSSNLNGKFYKGGQIPEKRYDGITWKPWAGANYSLKKVAMKIRPVSAN